MAAEKSSYTGGLSPEYALLGFLSEGPGHGYELHQRLVHELGFVWHISQSQLYSILKRLEAQGLVTSSKVAQKKLPERQVLALSPAGQRRFEAWLAAPTASSVRAMRVEFTTRLYFLQRRAPESIPPLLEAQKTAILADTTRLQTMLDGAPAELVFNRLGLDLRIRQLKSLLDWLNACGEKLMDIPPGE